MQELNLCRQFAKDFAQGMVRLIDEEVDDLKHPAELKDAIKFYIPSDGVALDDPQLLGIIDDDLHLPYPKIVLEFLRQSGYGGMVKHLLLVEEMFGKITVKIAIKLANDPWLTYPGFALQSNLWHEGNQNGLPLLRVMALVKETVEIKDMQEFILQQAYCILSLLNALACSNVEHVCVKNSHNREGKKKKDILPFDDYHILTIRQTSGTGSGKPLLHDRKSPRQHLRRGHIRKYSSGLKIWIEAMLVSSGSNNFISKSYQINNH
jgi:hypothetical protein